MAREAVEVVDAKMELACGKLSILHGKQENLVKDGVQSLAVHLGLMLGFAFWQQVDLHVWVGRSRKVLGRKILGFVDLHDELLQVTVVFEDEVQAAAAVRSSAVVRVHRPLFVELRLDAAQTWTRYGLLSLELGQVEIRIGDVHLSPDGVVPETRRKGADVCWAICWLHMLDIFCITRRTLIKAEGHRGPHCLTNASWELLNEYQWWVSDYA